MIITVPTMHTHYYRKLIFLWILNIFSVVMISFSKSEPNSIHFTAGCIWGKLQSNNLGELPRGENVSLRVCKLVGKSAANSWLARVCQVCTHANSQLAYYVQTCCKSGGCELGNGANLCKSVGKFENLQKFASRANPLKTLSLRFVCIQCKLLESV